MTIVRRITIIFLLLVLFGALGLADDEGRRWGMIGAPPLPERVSMIPERVDGEGYQAMRLRFGEEVPDWALALGRRPRGYLEQELRIKATLKADAEIIRVGATGELVTLKEQEPGGFAAFDWGLRRNREFTISDLVEGVRFLIDDKVQSPLQGGSGSGRYALTPEYESGRLSAEIDLEYFGGRTTLAFALDEDPPPRFALQNLRVDGFFTRPIPRTPPPFAPSAQIDVGGHFVLHLPAHWFSPGGEDTPVELILIEKAGGVERPVARRTLSRLRPRQGDHSLPVRADQVFAEFWRLDGGPYLVQAAVVEAGAAPAPFRSPEFTSSDIMGALFQRLNSFSLELFGLPFGDWQALRERDPEQAEQLLWKGFYQAARLFHGSVEIVNLSDKALQFPQVVSLFGIFGDGRELSYGSRKVFLGTREDSGADLLVPHDARQRIRFEPFQLSGEGPQQIAQAQQLRLFDDLIGFEARASPHQVGNGRQAVRIESFSGARSEDPRFALAQAMKSLGALPEPPPGDPAEYLEALERVFSGEFEALSQEMEEAYWLARELHELHFRSFKKLVAEFESRMERFGGGLGKLELEMNGRFGEGDHIVFGAPDLDHPRMGPAASIRSETFELENPFSRKLGSLFGALFNPEFSFALDPHLQIAGSLSGGEGGGGQGGEMAGTALRSGQAVIGLDRWRRAHDIPAATEERLQRELYFNPRIGETFAQIVTAGDGLMSAALRRKMALREFDQAKGQIHEEIVFDTLVGDELARLRSRFDGELVALSGAQVSGGQGDQLTDGVIIGVKSDGSLQLLRIIEAKAGESSAGTVGAQMVKDRQRIKAGGLSLRNLTADQQGKLGLSETRADLSADRLQADFSDASLFTVVVPADVKLDPRLPRGTAELELPAAERQAIQKALANPRRSGYSADELVTVTQLAFNRAGHTVHPWNARELSYREFAEVTARSLPSGRSLRDIPEAELRENYRQGKRVDPATGHWVAVFESWEKPVMTPDEIMKFWDAAHPNPRAGSREKALAKARGGQRFYPQTKRFRDPTSRSTSLFVVDPTLPRALLPDDDFMIWWEKNKPPGSTLSDQEVLQRRRDNKVFSPDTKRFRNPSRADSNIARRVEQGAVSRRWAVAERKSTRLRRVLAGTVTNQDLTTEVADRLAAAFREVERIGQERLVVTLARDTSVRPYQTNVVVRLRTADQEEPMDLPQETQKVLLKNWYRHHWGIDETPPWVKAAGPALSGE